MLQVHCVTSCRKIIIFLPSLSFKIKIKKTKLFRIKNLLNKLLNFSPQFNTESVATGLLVQKDVQKRSAIMLSHVNNPSYFNRFLHFVAFICSSLKKNLKIQSCKLYNNKYMIASMQITNTKIFAFLVFLIFKTLSHNVLLIKRKDNRNCSKVHYFLREQKISLVSHCKITNSQNAKFPGYF